MTDPISPSPSERKGWFSEFWPRMRAGIVLGAWLTVLAFSIAIARTYFYGYIAAAVVLVGAVTTTIWERKFGLVTGVILGAILLVVGVSVLLFALCDAGPLRRIL